MLFDAGKIQNSKGNGNVFFPNKRGAFRDPLVHNFGSAWFGVFQYCLHAEKWVPYIFRDEELISPLIFPKHDHYHRVSTKLYPII